MEVTREIELESAPDEVWEAITESDWLGEEREHRARPGGRREGRVARGLGGGVRARRAAHDLVADGDEESSRVQFDLEETEAGTRLVVTETRPLIALESQLPSGPVMLAA